jgi:hypothetical protein
MTSSSATCPGIGALRAWLDHELELPGLDRHLTACPACTATIADLQANAASVSAAFLKLGPIRLPSVVETAAAHEHLDRRRRSPVRVSINFQSPESIPMMFTRMSTSWRYAASGFAAVLALSLVVAFTPQGNAAAAAFLAQFRSQQVAGIEITPQTQGEIVKTLDALRNLGTLQTPSGLGRAATKPDSTATLSLSEASQAVGFSLQTPDPTTLPAGVDKTPHIQVMPASQIRFTFDKNKARAYYQSTGHPEVTLPDKFDGATLVVSIPSTAMLQYGNPNSKDALIVGEAGELLVDVEGGKVSLVEMRDFLLGLPGLPPATASQLKQIQNWNETLPVPIPVDKVNWQSTTFNGNQGLLLNDNSGVGSAAIWHANGHLYGVAGSLRATDLKKIASSLGAGH